MNISKLLLLATMSSLLPCSASDLPKLQFASPQDVLVLKNYLEANPQKLSERFPGTDCLSLKAPKCGTCRPFSNPTFTAKGLYEADEASGTCLLKKIDLTSRGATENQFPSDGMLTKDLGESMSYDRPDPACGTVKADYWKSDNGLTVVHVGSCPGKRGEHYEIYASQEFERRRIKMLKDVAEEAIQPPKKGFPKQNPDWLGIYRKPGTVIPLFVLEGDRWSTFTSLGSSLEQGEDAKPGSQAFKAALWGKQGPGWVEHWELWTEDGGRTTFQRGTPEVTSAPYCTAAIGFKIPGLEEAAENEHGKPKKPVITTPGLKVEMFKEMSPDSTTTRQLYDRAHEQLQKLKPVDSGNQTVITTLRCAPISPAKRFCFADANLMTRVSGKLKSKAAFWLSGQATNLWGIEADGKLRLIREKNEKWDTAHKVGPQIPRALIFKNDRVYLYSEGDVYLIEKLTPNDELINGASVDNGMCL